MKDYWFEGFGWRLLTNWRARLEPAWKPLAGKDHVRRMVEYFENREGETPLLKGELPRFYN